MKIALSGLNNTDNPAPGIGVAKGLKEYDLIGLGYDPNEPGIYQGVFKHIFLMPYPSLGFEQLLERLIYIKRQTECEMVWPNLDAELPLYIKHQDELQKIGLQTFLPSFEQFEMRDKAKLAKLCQELQILHPKTFIANSIDEMFQIVQETGFPVMIKGNYYKAFRVNSLEEAVEKSYAIVNEWGFPLLVQEVVDGVELNYAGVSDSKLYGGICIKKLTTTSLGKVWSAVTIHNEQMHKLAQKFVEITKWRGPFELEAIVTNNGIYLIEINPRFPAWIGFSVDVGLNLPKIALDVARQKRVPTNFSYPEKKMYVRYVEEIVCDYSNFTKLLSKKEL